MNKEQYGVLENGKVVRQPTRCAFSNQPINSGGVKRQIAGKNLYYGLTPQAHQYLSKHLRERMDLEQSIVDAHALYAAGVPGSEEDTAVSVPVNLDEMIDEELVEYIHQLELPYTLGASRGEMINLITDALDKNGTPYVVSRETEVIEIDLMEKSAKWLTSLAESLGLEVPTRYTKTQIIDQMQRHALEKDIDLAAVAFTALNKPEGNDADDSGQS